MTLKNLLRRCDQEIAASLAVHDEAACLIAIWRNDWEVEKQLILKEIADA